MEIEAKNISLTEKAKVPVIVLTGGPCGGKTMFIRGLHQDPEWAGTFVSLPEIISFAGRMGVSLREKRFQRLVVKFQMALENEIHAAIRPEEADFIICERGSLDPLAYWLLNGWSEAEFFETCQADLYTHFRRYYAVIHLVTAADGASEFYKACPNAHRRETPNQAIRLDIQLQRIWDKHPAYFRLPNIEKKWHLKTADAKEILSQIRGGLK